MKSVEGYWTLSGFEDIYLEESWLLSIQPSGTTLTLVVDFVLLTTHPQYRVPLPEERYCYRNGWIRFEDVTTLSWSGRGAPPANDATGEEDLGTIDEFEAMGDTYSIVGDFGHISVISSAPRTGFFE